MVEYAVTMLDIVAGSVAERRLVENLSEYLIVKGLSVNVTPVEVLEWGEIECFIDDLGCTVQPPVESANVSGVLGKDIAITPTTRDPDNMWVTYWLNAKREVSAVVFYDEYPYVRKRRIVVNEVPSYSYGIKMLARRPAIHLPLSTLPMLRKMRYVTISVKTFKRLSQGYVLDVVTGNREPRVAVVTHHDRWLTGFRDNSIGVLTFLKLAQLLEKMRVSARLVSFTAEEFGDPSESSFYWAYGSRAYSKRLVSDSDLAIVIDTAHREPVDIDYAGVRGLESKLSAVRTIKSEIGIGYTDAVSMVNQGIPSIVLHNLDAIKPVYHTDADVYPGKSVEAVIVKLSKAIVNVVREYEKRSIENLYRAYVEHVKASSPPDVKSYLEDVSDPVAMSKCLMKHYTTLVIEGTYSDFNTEIKLLTYSDILRGVEIGQKYTILRNDVTVSFGDVDRFRKFAKAMLEEVVRCYRS